MTWQEEIYKFKILKIERPGIIQGFNQTYRLRVYGENGEVLNYPFGNFGNLKEVRKRTSELISQIQSESQHPCELEEEIEIVTDNLYSTSRKFTKTNTLSRRKVKRLSRS